jgi:hypothetical protein
VATLFNTIATLNHQIEILRGPQVSELQIKEEGVREKRESRSTALGCRRSITRTGGWTTCDKAISREWSTWSTSSKNTESMKEEVLTINIIQAEVLEDSVTLAQYSIMHNLQLGEGLLR